jgi:hypothetical protein
MPKGKRGCKFSQKELESLLKSINEIVPVENPEWECIWEMHNSCYHIFQELAKKNANR